MTTAHWQIELHEDFDLRRFLGTLKPLDTQVGMEFLAKVVLFENLTMAPNLWIKPLGTGLFEFRIGAGSTLVRIFFTFKKERVVLLLGAYDKGADPTNKRQQQEISIARKRLKNA
jgi:putative component of toxin-antitoxin plasmid stabilization module